MTQSRLGDLGTGGDDRLRGGVELRDVTLIESRIPGDGVSFPQSLRCRRIHAVHLFIGQQLGMGKAVGTVDLTI